MEYKIEEVLNSSPQIMSVFTDIKMEMEYKIEEVWGCIIDENVGIISINGEGGVGKTTLLKHIYTKLTTSTIPLHFDTVIWVTVSQNLSVDKVQDDIWKTIGVFNVDWVDKCFEDKSKSISEFLSEKKFVLLLDDLGEYVNLTELGVPDPEINNSKVIFTTRDESLFLDMEGQATIQMFALVWEQAWELFKNKLGDQDQLISDPRILDLAQSIARTCRGLPLLLCTVARAMSTMTTYDQWLRAIRGVQFQEIQEDGKEYVFSSLLLCFDCLSKEARTCLLYYSLFPEDFLILKNVLIDFWICENLLCHENVLDLGYKTIDALTDACLLEEEQVNYVKLLDLIRDFALTTKYEYRMSLGAVLLPAEKRQMGWILPMRNSIQNLPYYVPDNFFIFLFNHNPFIMVNAKFRSVPISPFDYELMGGAKIDNFYQFINALTVLDLSNSGVEAIPREIAKCVSLEYLNLSHTWIDHLPIEIKELNLLKCLNLEYDEQLRVIPKQLIIELSSLQVLKMFRCGFSVQEVDDNILSLTHMDIDPILCLEHLKVLSITITCDLALHKFFSCSKFLSCTQSLSLEVFWKCRSLDISPLAAMENLLMLEIHQFEDLEELNCYPHHLELARGRSNFEKLREITLDDCSSLLDITWVVLVPNLAILKVQNCKEMEEIISSRKMGESSNGDNREIFAKLEILTLENLPELKSIYQKALPFRYLKKIEVIDCSMLKKLPLDCRSANANELLIIGAEEDWWENIEWEDDNSRVTFLPCFKPNE